MPGFQVAPISIRNSLNLSHVLDTPTFNPQLSPIEAPKQRFFRKQQEGAPDRIKQKFEVIEEEASKPESNAVSKRDAVQKLDKILVFVNSLNSKDCGQLSSDLNAIVKKLKSEEGGVGRESQENLMRRIDSVTSGRHLVSPCEEGRVQARRLTIMIENDIQILRDMLIDESNYQSNQEKNYAFLINMVLNIFNKHKRKYFILIKRGGHSIDDEELWKFSHKVQKVIKRGCFRKLANVWKTEFL